MSIVFTKLFSAFLFIAWIVHVPSAGKGLMPFPALTPTAPENHATLLITTHTWHDRNTYEAQSQHIRGTIATHTWYDRDPLEINACSMNDDASQNLRPLIITYLSNLGSCIP